MENADGLGRHLARWLIARGETVLDVPTTATARVRELSRGGRRKNDRIDAAAAACVAALQGEGRLVVPDEHSDALRMLDERRNNLSASRTRTVNQLHALLRELLAGGAPTGLSANAAATALRGLRAQTLSDRVRVGLCKDLIADIRRLDRQLATNQADIDQLLVEHGTRLRTMTVSVRCWRLGSSAAPDWRPASRPQPRMPPTTEPRPLGSPAPTDGFTDSAATATGSSTLRSTPSP